MFGLANNWCEATLQKYGSSAAVSQELIVIIEEIKSVTEVLTRQMSIFTDDKGFPYHINNIRTNLENLLFGMANAMRLVSAEFHRQS
jgi:hypothetical protein